MMGVVGLTTAAGLRRRCAVDPRVDKPKFMGPVFGRVAGAEEMGAGMAGE